MNAPCGLLTSQELKEPIEQPGESEKKPTVLFDTLPDGVVENILRCLSEYPTIKDWRLYMDPELTDELCDVDGSFSDAIYTLGTTLTLGNPSTKDMHFRFDSFVTCIDDSCGGVHQRRLVGNNVIFIDKAISRVGASFTTISVSQKYFEMHSVANVLPYLVQACLNVCGLEIASPFELRPWTDAFGNGLKYLKCDDMPRDIQIWDKIGPTLEVLIVNKVIGSTITIKTIQTFCRMLRHIDVSMTGCETRAWYTMLTSYGPQLEFATILDTENRYVVPLLCACTNARFVVDVGCPSHELLNFLKHQLVGVRELYSRQESTPFDGWASAWDSCYNLEILKVISYNRDDIRAIMNDGKRNLRHLSIYIELGTPKEIMDAFACKTGALEYLDIVVKCRRVSISIDTFDNLVHKNKALSWVNVYISNKDSGDQRLIHQLVTCFLKAPRLALLDIQSEFGDGVLRPALVDLCVRHRKRRLFVKVLGQIYLK